MFRLRTWLCAAAALWCAAAQAADLSRVSGKTMYGRRYARLSDVAACFGLKTSIGKEECNLVTASGKTVASMQPDQRAGSVNGMPVVFNYAPALQGSTAWIAWSDVMSTLVPLYRRSALRRHQTLHVVIDPGHGGDDPGAAGRVSREKNVTLAIAAELRRELSGRVVTVNGRPTRFQVTMTRTRDATLSLDQRAEICNRARGQLFISIHADAAEAAISGIGCFSLTSPGAPSYNATRVVSETNKGQAWCGNSLFLAYCVQKNLALRIRETPSRGLKRARFSVLRNTDCPAILIETGFISNPREERNLNSALYRKRLVAAIADGVVEYQKQVSSR